MESMDTSIRDLYEMVYRKTSIFPENILSFIGIALIDALIFCSNKNIIHRDLKPDNVLLNLQGDIKLCDFGVSQIEQDSFSSKYVGMVAYWPPERFDMANKTYDVRSDVWSLGITLAEVALGRHPYALKSDSVLSSFATIQGCILKIKNTEIAKFISERSYSEKTQEFVKTCLRKYENRPKCQELKETSLYKTNDPIIKDDVAAFLRETTKTSESEKSPTKNRSLCEALLLNSAINTLKFPNDNQDYIFRKHEFICSKIISEDNTNSVKDYFYARKGKNIAEFVQIRKICANSSKSLCYRRRK